MKDFISVQDACKRYGVVRKTLLSKLQYDSKNDKDLMDSFKLGNAWAVSIKYLESHYGSKEAR